MAMTLGKVRSSLQSALRGGRGSDLLKRGFASSSHQDAAYEAKEASKWEKITYVGIATCTVLSIYNLSKGHHHDEEPPPYPYLHIRNKEFPWGSVDLAFAGSSLAGGLRSLQLCLDRVVSASSWQPSGLLVQMGFLRANTINQAGLVFLFMD
ncbi:hypothetical protein Cgig2_007250 [Carnegiea gigantea]|uniref:Cytochrome c oxidase subunit VIa n=1 Tax=Carnegiea gigantea TaxID=171969 RepID=A0A9Q1QRD8_9CARY|nr:hypothetical protein Cgig2_007250 [Carnegiea gigantea]